MGRGRLGTFIPSEDQTPPNLQNSDSEWFLKYAKESSPILSLLCWTGLLEDSDKNSRKRNFARIFQLLLILVIVDIVVTSLLQSKKNFIRLLIYFCNYILNVLIWFAMRRIRKQLTAFLRQFHEINPQAMTWKTTLILYGIFLSAVITSALNAITRYKEEMTAQLAYGYVINNIYAQIVIIFTKSVIYSILYPTCPTIVAFLLCLFCRWICEQVRGLTLQIEKCSPNQFTVSFQSNILSQKQRIDDLLFLLQRVFYLPSFLICAASFCSCCTIVAWILQGFDSSVELTILITFFLYFFMCAVSLLTCMWTAGGLPVALEAFNEEFHKRAQLRLLAGGKEDEIDFEKHLSERPVFVLTGCDVIHFKRSTILALAGAVLTYTLLILKM